MGCPVSRNCDQLEGRVFLSSMLVQCLKVLIQCSLVEEHNKYKTTLRSQKEIATKSNELTKWIVDLDIFEEYIHELILFCFFLRENEFPPLFSIYPTKKSSETPITLFYIKLQMKTNSQDTSAMKF